MQVYCLLLSYLCYFNQMINRLTYYFVRSRHLNSINTGQHLTLNANGPAIKGGCVTRRRIRPPSCFFSRKIVPVARRVRRGFCLPIAIGTWQELAKLYVYRGTTPISGWELIPVQSCFKRALARSRYVHSKSV